MKTLICIALLAVTTLSSFAPVGNKVKINHRTSAGMFVPIEVEYSAVAAHIAHGDYIYGIDGPMF